MEARKKQITAATGGRNQAAPQFKTTTEDTVQGVKIPDSM